jgi:RNA polymerase sigma-70 factor (family 1)
VDEAELMTRLRANDASALDELVSMYWRPVVTYARSLLSDWDAAYDIGQEAFVRLWQQRDRWDARGSARVWLFRTVRNLSISEHRKRGVRARWTIRQAMLQSPQRTPLQDAEDAELRSAVETAVEQLSPRRREVFTLFHLQNLSYNEVAEVMGIRPQTVANYLQAAIAELRVALQRFFPALSAPADSGDE